MMPLAGGREVVAWMQENRGDAGKRCVIIVSAAGKRDLLDLDREHVFDVVLKPFEVADVMAAIVNCLTQSGVVVSPLPVAESDPP
jgi:CheY-like chemotaxis protein